MAIYFDHQTNEIESVGSEGTLENFASDIIQGSDGNTYNLRAGNQGTPAGNARGENSVDLQTARSLADYAATGGYSAILGGQDNWCAGPHAVISGGQTNSASATHGAITGGYSNQISNNYGFIGGGYDSLVDGQYGSVVGGYQNHCNSNYGVVIGGRESMVHGNAPYGVAHGLNAQANHYGERAFANGEFFDKGDRQAAETLLSRSVTHSSTAWFDLYLDGTSTSYLLVVDTAVNGNTAWTFEALIIGATSGMGKTFSFKIQGCVECDNGAISILNQTTTTIYDGDDTSFDARAAVDGTNRALLIQVSDSDGASDVVRWVCHLHTVVLRWNS